jgi:SAM-dependent methyltransferase
VPEGRGDFDLAEAYAVETPAENRELYRRWAATYESGFIADRGYVYHEHVVALLVDRGPRGAALDVGCGTGLVGVALATAGLDEVTAIDGIDISPEMLEQARTKRIDGGAVYRDLIEADLTGPVDVATGSYGTVVSVGTFTHGHLGPESIDELLRLAAPGAAFALGINAEHYLSHGFADHLAAALDLGRIVGLELAEAPIYTAGDDDHADDVATVALFNRGAP